jgi:single-stranded-DNA-specific exonuclease
MSKNPVEYVNSLSVLGKEWSDFTPTKSQGYEDISTEICGVVEARGFDPATFFNPSFKAMPDPNKLVGMSAAVTAFCDAVQAGKKIGIFGDYDVDGATSTSLLFRWIGRMGGDSVFYIPDRMTEGYGPNVNAVRILKEQEAVELLMFLDTGTTAHESLDLAAELGMEIVIIDHHEQDSRDPKGILVNPNQRREEGREFGYLCTVGLVFLFLVGVQREMRSRGFFNDTRQEIDLREWLGIVALGTVADLMPLVGLNRAYVALGLPRMANIPGIKALSELNRSKKDNLPAAFNEHNCGFVYGPCINAAGRIGDTRTGTFLLSTDDEQRAMEIARDLVEINSERKAMTELAKEKAIALATTTYKNDAVIVVYDNDWHPGIVGIVAGRIKEATNKPAIVMGRHGENLSGSARTHENFKIGAAVIEAKESGLLIKGGGHHMAAGVTIAEENVEEFRAFMNKAAEGTKAPPVRVDLALPVGKLSVNLVKSMDRMQPFGMGNPKPKVVLYGGFISGTKVMNNGHVKVFLTGEAGTAEAILFWGEETELGRALLASKNKFVDILGSAQVNDWGTQHTAQIKIEDAMIQGWNSLTADHEQAA